jgi:hypothetical protein
MKSVSGVVCISGMGWLRGSGRRDVTPRERWGAAAVSWAVATGQPNGGESVCAEEWAENGPQPKREIKRG